MLKVGLGYDLHRFAEGRKFILGGVEIPFIKGLQGHSDADVVLHALSDAILGAAGRGDIGEYFPDSDKRYKDMGSAVILKKVIDIVREDKWRIVNADIVIVLEEPRLEAFKARIRESVAAILGVNTSMVNIKATTAEGMDSVGRNEAAAAQAVVLMER